MQKYADYIRRIEIDSLWSGKKHVVWELNRQVNILSGINGVGKSTILNKVIKSVNTNGDIINHLLKGVRIEVEPADATHIRFDTCLMIIGLFMQSTENCSLLLPSIGPS